MRKNWIDVFRKTVKNNPEKKAVICGDKCITFSELDKKSLAFAEYMRKRSSSRNTPVVVILPKSIDVVIADLAIMYCSNIFSNLDYKTPDDRLLKIIDNLSPIFIITDTKGTERFQNADAGKLINMDEVNLADSVDIDKIMEISSSQIDTDPFCIINTSGSTGVPKSVVLNHKSFFDFYDWSMETFGFSDDEVIGSLSPIVFDIYEYELTLMMGKSSTIVLLDNSLAAFPARLLSQLAEHKATFIFWVPTIMVNIANMDLLSKIDLSCLKRVWFAGEVFPTKQFNYWRRQLPEAVFANLYGPIEITLDCIYHIIDHEIPDLSPLPIGIPCKNTDILLLNENNEKCQNDEEGEICVRGTSLAMGYYNNPEKTAAAFVQNPLNNHYPETIYRTGDIGVLSSEDGLIHFKGRRDSLIKHMGYRIELSEIEHVLVNTLKVVKNCCAVYDYAKKEIVLFYEKSESDSTQIRVALSGVLPRYMVPTVWKEIEELPRNTNGKIDRLQLSNEVNA